MGKHWKKYNSKPKYRNENLYDVRWYDTYDQDYEKIRLTPNSHKSFNQLQAEIKANRKELWTRRAEISVSKHGDWFWILGQFKVWFWFMLVAVSFAGIYIMKPTLEEMKNSVVEQPKTEFVNVEIK